jgi:hypothetical protein
MKPIPNYLVPFTLALLAFQGSCIRDEPKPVIANDSTFLSYWFFPTGSYWIYKDSAGVELDTFTIIASGEYLQLDRFSEVDWQFSAVEVENRGVVKPQVGRPRPYHSQVYYYALDQRWGDSESAVRFFWIKTKVFTNLENHLFAVDLDSLQVNGRWFRNVIYMRNVDTQANDDTVRREYYARNIGIVKRAYASGKVWELQEYYIAP